MNKRSVRSGSLSLILFVLVSAVAAHSADAPIPVSPGSPSGFPEIATSCPTFSWAPAAGSTGQELVIYRVKEERGSENEPVRRVVLPGNVGSWTPSLADCLEPDNAYAWSVRAEHRDSRDTWSEAGLFRVGSAPSLEEVEAALSVLERYRVSRLSGPPASSRPGDIAELPPSPASSVIAPLSPISQDLEAGSLFPFDIHGILVEAEDVPSQDLAAVRGLVAENTASGSPFWRAGVVGEIIGNSAGEFEAMNQWGVLGITNGLSGTGVRGDAVASSGVAQGVLGISNSPGGTGGLFVNHFGGAAIRAQGRVIVEGDLSLTPTDSPPTCTIVLKGTLYYDASFNSPCYCEGTNRRSVVTNAVCT